MWAKNACVCASFLAFSLHPSINSWFFLLNWSSTKPIPAILFRRAEISALASRIIFPFSPWILVTRACSDFERCSWPNICHGQPLVLYVLYVNLSMLDLMIWLSETRIANEQTWENFPTKYEIAQRPTPLYILPLSHPFHLYSSQPLPSPLLFPLPNIFPPYPYPLLLHAPTTLLAHHTPLPNILSWHILLSQYSLTLFTLFLHRPLHTILPF